MAEGNMNTRQFRSAAPFAARSKRWSSNAGSVGAEALNRGLYLRFNADVARRANSDEKPAVFRVNREMPVCVTLDDAEQPPSW